MINPHAVHHLGLNGAKFFFDTFPIADQAYSFRKLNRSYTGFCCRIRNLTNGLFLDIGFVNNFVDIASIISFTGSAISELVDMYDHTGNGRTLSFTTTFRPVICNNGTLFYESGNLVAQANSEIRGTFTPYAMTDISIFTVHSVIALGGGYGGYYTNRATSQRGILITSNNASTWQTSLIPLNTSGNEVAGRLKSRNTSKAMPTGLYIENWIYNDASNTHTLEETGVNMTLVNSATGWGNYTNVGRWAGYNGQSIRNSFCEMIVYASDQTANKTNINNEIKTRYSL